MSEQCVRILARKMDMSLFPVDDCYCVVVFWRQD